MAYNETPTDWTAMFLKNREFRIRIAKTDAPAEETTETTRFPFEDPEFMRDMTKEFVKNTAIAIGCVLAAATVLHTISEIAIKKTKSADNE